MSFYDQTTASVYVQYISGRRALHVSEADRQQPCTQTQLGARDFLVEKE